jgi:hypothetical protein
LFLFCFSSPCVPCVASFSGLFLFCFSSPCVTYVSSFSGISNFDCPFGILFCLLRILRAIIVNQSNDCGTVLLIL